MAFTASRTACNTCSCAAVSSWLQMPYAMVWKFWVGDIVPMSMQQWPSMMSRCVVSTQMSEGSPKQLCLPRRVWFNKGEVEGIGKGIGIGYR